MTRFADTLLDGNNIPVPGVQITVRTAAGGLATLTTDAGAALANPILADVFGVAYFNATPGSYTLEYRLSPLYPPFKVVGVVLDGGATAVTYTQGGTGATTRTVSNKLQEMGISPRDFGAVADGATDDSAAVQKAINACLAYNPPAPLRVDGYFGMAAAVNIDRPIASSFSTWVVQGIGREAGFYLTTGVNLFDTTLTYGGTDPIVGEIAFRDLNLVAASPSQASQTLTAGKFLNVAFERCTWYSLKCVGTTIYTQGLRIRDCRAYNWSGNFIESNGTYDFSCDGLRTKFGGGVFSFLGTTRPIYRASITNGCFEGCGTILTACGASELLFSQNYCEFNNAAAINLTAGTGANAAVTITDNLFQQTSGQKADSTFYDIKWGGTLRGQSRGNYCDGKLHDTTGMTGSNLLSVNGDVVTTELYKGFKTGLTDSAWAGVGNVDFHDPDWGFVWARGASWSSNRVITYGPGTAYGPGVVQNGAYVPVKTIYGNQNPQTNPTFYGSPYWTIGSRVIAQPTGTGQPREFVCTASGQPGTWVAVNL